MNREEWGKEYGEGAAWVVVSMGEGGLWERGREYGEASSGYERIKGKMEGGYGTKQVQGGGDDLRMRVKEH